MIENAFIGKVSSPTEAELTDQLGPARSTWDDLVARLASDCNVVVQEWNSYSAKAGWALRFKVKKRNILYLSPCHGSFGTTLILGDRAVAAVRQSKLPRKIVRMVEEGKRYPEGTPVRFEKTSARDVEAIVKLAAIKLQY